MKLTKADRLREQDHVLDVEEHRLMQLEHSAAIMQREAVRSIAIADAISELPSDASYRDVQFAIWSANATACARAAGELRVEHQAKLTVLADLVDERNRITEEP